MRGGCVPNTTAPAGAVSLLPGDRPMVALANTLVCNPVQPHWQDSFLAMLPSIRRQARVAFRYLRAEAREDAIAEVVAKALVAYARLVQSGRQSLAYPTVLARYAVRQFLAARRVGTSMNCQDVYSPAAQRRFGFTVKRLYEEQQDAEAWVEATMEDTRTSVPDQAAFRIDFPEWLANQSPRARQIAELLAVGHNPLAVAQSVGVSPGRVSQLRRELHESWQRFHGDESSPKSTSGLIASRRRVGQGRISLRDAEAVCASCSLSTAACIN
jgi:hypothetical protein